MDYKKAIINEILSLEEIDNDKINNDHNSKEIDHFALSILEKRQHFKKKLDGNDKQVGFHQQLCEWRFHYGLNLTQRIENFLS